jgi:hypothetical protein
MDDINHPAGTGLSSSLKMVEDSFGFRKTIAP